MNWEAIGAVGEIIGAIAVFGTLLYLATQIRQIRSDLHVSSLRDSNQMGNEILASLSDSPDLARVVSKANNEAGSLEPWELLMIDSYFMRCINVWELTLEQLEMGALNAPKDSVYGVLGRFLNQPWIGKAWDRNKAGYPISFQRLIDSQFDVKEEKVT